MIVSLLLLQAVTQVPVEPSPRRVPLPIISCNVAVAMFAPRSDRIDEETARALDKIPPEARAALEVEGVKLMVLPHPVTLRPANEARQRALADARGQRIKDYLTTRGYRADRIAIRPAVVSADEPKNWVEGALVMMESAPEVWDKTRLGAVC
jgi:hypothetical protein